MRHPRDRTMPDRVHAAMDAMVRTSPPSILRDLRRHTLLTQLVKGDDSTLCRGSLRHALPRIPAIHLMVPFARHTCLRNHAIVLSPRWPIPWFLSHQIG